MDKCQGLIELLRNKVWWLDDWVRVSSVLKVEGCYQSAAVRIYLKWSKGETEVTASWTAKAHWQTRGTKAGPCGLTQQMSYCCSNCLRSHACSHEKRSHDSSIDTYKEQYNRFSSLLHEIHPWNYNDLSFFCLYLNVIEACHHIIYSSGKSLDIPHAWKTLPLLFFSVMCL